MIALFILLRWFVLIKGHPLALMEHYTVEYLIECRHIQLLFVAHLEARRRDELTSALALIDFLLLD